MPEVWKRGMMTGGVGFLLLVACAVCAAHGEWEQVYDHNGDGVVSVSEMMKAVTELDHVRHHEPDAMFHLQDTMMQMRDLVSSEESQPRGWSVERMRSMYRHIFDDPSENEPQQIHLAIRNATAMTVMWVTKASEAIPNPMIQWGKSGASLQNLTSVLVNTYNAGTLGWTGWIYEGVLVDLELATVYQYQVGFEGGEWSDVMEFRTQPQSPAPSKNVIAVFGDMGTIMPLGFAVTEQMEKDVADQGPFDLIVHAGDIAYAGTGATREFEGIWDLWGRQVQPLASVIPYMTAVGNHEKYFNFTSYRSRIHMPPSEDLSVPNFYYSFDFGSVHFVMMCTEAYVFSYDPGSPQYKWLEKDLANANNNRAVTPWIVVVGHRPMYSSDTASDSGNLQQIIEPLLEQYSVDVAIWGHMHEYERSFPVYNNTVQYTPSGSPAVYPDPKYPTHLTIGTAGAFILERWEHPQPTWSAFRAERYGYGQLTVHNATHLQFEFLQRSSREAIDGFIIQRSSAP